MIITKPGIPFPSEYIFNNTWWIGLPVECERCLAEGTLEPGDDVVTGYWQGSQPIDSLIYAFIQCPSKRCGGHLSTRIFDFLSTPNCLSICSHCNGAKQLWSNSAKAMIDCENCEGSGNAE